MESTTKFAVAIAVIAITSAVTIEIDNLNSGSLNYRCMKITAERLNTLERGNIDFHTFFLSPQYDRTSIGSRDEIKLAPSAFSENFERRIELERIADPFIDVYDSTVKLDRELIFSSYILPKAFIDEILLVDRMSYFILAPDYYSDKRYVMFHILYFDSDNNQITNVPEELKLINPCPPARPPIYR